MQLRYRYRIYPSAAQRTALARAFGCARTVFNDGLRVRSEAHAGGLPYISDGDLSKQIITQAKRRPERAWLGEVSAVVLQQALADLNCAYRNFFSSITGRRKGPKVSPPRLRSRKDSRQTIRFTRNAPFRITASGKLRLPKIGDMDVRWSRSLPSAPSSVTVIKDAAGRYFASFVVTTTDTPLSESPREVGIDLGLTHFAVLSDGRKIANPRFLRHAERRLSKARRALSRKTRGSANRRKAVTKVARAHVRVADARRDWAHKLSTQIIRDNQAVYVENLCVSGLGRTKLAKSVHDAGWSLFTAMLAYKAERYGRHFAKIDRWWPSSKLCGVCGALTKSLPLNVRSWKCPCGAVHDRDVNAAKNILAAGRADRSNACGDRVRPPLAEALVDETGSLRGASPTARTKVPALPCGEHVKTKRSAPRPPGVAPVPGPGSRWRRSSGG
ncbi:RNA-guided endonuclease InsQ/TnpB family protein [Nonomuraea sp. NPDC050383]|uniref:RNA-guided endonuclease InsQ/TnpB family protein n=1 Tax=Nonomuraea sp. NPDC050383 TaxID=3364362 RepID=UPI0037934DDF